MELDNMLIEKNINGVLMSAEIGIDDEDYFIRVGDNAHPEFTWVLCPVTDIDNKSDLADVVNTNIDFFYPRQYVMDNSENVYSARAILDLAYTAQRIELMMEYVCEYLRK